MLRYQNIKTKAYRILDLTSLTVDEFEQLVPPSCASEITSFTPLRPRLCGICASGRWRASHALDVVIASTVPAHFPLPKIACCSS